MKDKINYKLLNLLIMVAVICLLYFTKGLWLSILNNTMKLLFPFIISFGLAYVIYPLVKKLQDAGSPKWLAILSVCVLGVGSLVIILILTIPLLYDQILLFISNISVFLSDITTKYEISFGALQSSLSEFSSNIISKLGSSISNGAITVFNASVGVITTGTVVVCAAIYFLIDMDKIRTKIKNYFNNKNKRKHYDMRFG